MNRRFFLFAAPAIVAAPSLMKVSALVMPAEPVVQVYPGGITELVTKTLRHGPETLTSTELRALVDQVYRRLHDAEGYDWLAPTA